MPTFLDPCFYMFQSIAIFINLCTEISQICLSEAHLSLKRRDPLMNSVRRLIVILFLLSGMAALTYSQAPVKLNGSEGMALLKSLTEVPMDANNTSLNNTSLNATNSSTKLTMARNSTGDIWSWGSRPKDPPLGQDQPGYDYLNDSV
jgi:hypothetical protein